ncbi:hypothetical protein GCM10007108_14700 [Thermogymnomonas acidicola]|uniref:Uncharacterized protein n=1 Tax=Thermogymnomonas acidicola TaxID=399579 RepID=A0AA37F9W1_9ARCH|nr:hypothetical protein [Thermogymnomonas acidicola]GGM77638.1 hypothetical protein GCM10007108_14700 [Thermogymnomonas acidicola]
MALASRLSKGMKRKLSVAIAMSQDPDIMVLDETFDGVDQTSSEEIVSMIRSIKEQGKSVILSSHSISYIYEVADEVIVMDSGRIVRRIHLPLKYVSVVRFAQGYGEVEQKLKSLGLDYDMSRFPLVRISHGNEGEDVNSLLVNNGLTVLEFRKVTVAELYGDVLNELGVAVQG